MKKLLLLSALVFCFGLAASWAVASLLIAPRPTNIGDLPPDLAGETIQLMSNSGETIRGWHIPSSESAGVILLFHGIRSNRMQLIERARLFQRNNLSVLAIDFQAHGESTGENITAGYLEKYDVQAAVAFAKRSHPGEPVGVVGVSLGGASALMGSPLGIDALVIESVYPEIERAIENRVSRFLGSLSYLPTKILLFQLSTRLGVETDALRPIDHIANTECPVFVISGSEDIHTTIQETRQLYTKAKTPKELWEVKGAAHVDLYRATGAEYEKRVLQFITRYFAEAVDETT